MSTALVQPVSKVTWMIPHPKTGNHCDQTQCFIVKFLTQVWSSPSQILVSGRPTVVKLAARRALMVLEATKSPMQGVSRPDLAGSGWARLSQLWVPAIYAPVTRRAPNLHQPWVSGDSGVVNLNLKLSARWPHSYSTLVTSIERN